MAETNRTTDSPTEYTPLYTIPRSEPLAYNIAELADAESNSDSSGHSSYTLCNHTNCDCASQQRPRPSTPPPPPPRPQNLRVRSAPPPQPQTEEAATSSGSTGSDRYRTWHVAEYNLEYAAWRAIERRRIARSNSDGGWRSWFPCFLRPSSSRPTSTTLDDGTQSEEQHDTSSSQEPVSAERMVYPAQDNGDRNDERASNAAESHTMDISCSVSRYVIKFPERHDQPTTAGSSSRPRGRVVTVESVVDSGEEQEEDVAVAESVAAA